MGVVSVPISKDIDDIYQKAGRAGRHAVALCIVSTCLVGR